MATNPFHFRHYDLDSFALYVNGKQIPSEGLSLGMDHEKTSVMGYRTLFEGSGIHHSNAGLQITHDMYIAGNFMLLFDRTPDLSASGHTSHVDSGNIRLELKFRKSLPHSITCLLYLKYDNSIRILFPKRFDRLLSMDTANTVYPAKCKVVSRRISIGSPTTFDRAVWHRHYSCRSSHKVSHWLAIHFEPKASSAYYFDSYGIYPLVPTIHAF